MRRLIAIRAVWLGFLVLSAPVLADDQFVIVAHTVAGGGVIKSESTDGQWELSGTVAQWEATKARELASGPWRLTGGFWALTTLEDLVDLLFRDRFEADTRSSNRR